MNFTKYLSLLICLFVVVSCSTKQKKDNDALVIENNIQLSIKKLSKNIKNIYLSNEATPIKKKLAILTFVNENGESSDLGKYISNTLQTNVFEPKIFALLERERIDSLLTEFEFNNNGLISSDETKKIGKMLGADLVLVGTISLQENEKAKPYFVITARLVNLESGEIVAIDSSNVYATVDLLNDYNSVVKSNIKSIVGNYNVLIKNVVVERIKDVDGSDPDIKIYISTDSSKVFSSNTYIDTFEINSDLLNQNITIYANEKLKISVCDMDIIDFDRIGEIRLTEKEILDSIKSKKSLILKFGGVTSLEVMFNKI